MYQKIKTKKILYIHYTNSGGYPPLEGSFRILAERGKGREWMREKAKKTKLRIPESRIRWLKPVKLEAVVETIGKYDGLGVPSVCLEMGRWWCWRRLRPECR